jgi:hypothetical protein
MQFDDLRNEVKSLAIDDLREDSDNYFEVVLIKEELTKLVSKLEKILGPAYSYKTKLASDIEKTIKEFGGINPGQTLYFSKIDTGIVFAMLWPWSDGKRATIKIIKQ